MAEILPIRRKTLSNQSINQWSSDKKDCSNLRKKPRGNHDMRTPTFKKKKETTTI